MQIVTGRRGEPHVTSRQMQAVYRSFLGDFALLDVGAHLAATATSNDNVRISDGVVAVQGIYAVIAYNEYDDNYIEPVSVGMKRIDTLILHYTKSNDIEDMQIEVVEGEEAVDNPVAPTIAEGGDAWEGTADIKVPIYDVLVTSFGLTVTPYSRMNTLIPTLDSIAERIPESIVTGVKGDSEALYRNGNVNITKDNIGLGNVDNTADTNKPVSNATQTALNLKADLTYVDAKIAAAYHAGGSKTVAELTSALLIADNMGKVYNMSDSGTTTSDFVEGAGEPINEGDNVGICNVGTEENPVYKFDLLSGFVDLSAYATTSAVNAGLEGKVDKVAGKGLSTEDYTTTDKTKLAGISEGATQTIANPADTATETLSKLEVGGVVYDVPQGTTGATNLSELNDVNLSGTAEGDILEYDSTANKWKNSNALQGAKTATGNPLTIESSESNLVECTAEVEAVQEGSGDPSPTNIRPIIGQTEVVIEDMGKNKFDASVFADATSSFKAISITLKANTTYTMSGDKAKVNGNSEVFFYITGSPSESNNSVSNGISRTLTTGTDGIVQIAYRQYDASLTSYHWQIEEGSTPTTYEPYKGKTYTIQLGDTIYGGTLDVTRGELRVDRGIITVNDFTVISNQTSSGGLHWSDTTVTFDKDKQTISSMLQLKTGSNGWTSTTPCFDASDGNAIRVYCTESNITDFKLTYADLQICYPLATPYTIQLTPQQIRLLKGTNNISCNTGDLSIKYYPDNVLGQLKGDIEKGLNAYYDYQIQALWDKINELQA